MGGETDEKGRESEERRQRQRQRQKERESERHRAQETGNDGRKETNGKEHIQREGMETGAEKWRLKDTENGVSTKRRNRNRDTS